MAPQIFVKVAPYRRWWWMTLPRSKTDQQGDGLTRALPRSSEPVFPVKALDDWLKHAGTHEGPVFRAVNRWDQLQPQPLSGGSVNRVLKTLGKTCGLDFAPTLSSHSFRRGLSTAAAREKVDFAQIKGQGGWKHDATVRGYIEDGEQFRENAANSLIAQVAELVEKGVGSRPRPVTPITMASARVCRGPRRKMASEPDMKQWLASAEWL